MSPSSRRAWIEILKRFGASHLSASPSSRRAWIEILCKSVEHLPTRKSPSSRRAWIEIEVDEGDAGQRKVALLAEGVDRNQKIPQLALVVEGVALLAEGVDRNFCAKAARGRSRVALLAEGVDRNTPEKVRPSVPKWSPSSRRAWIEIGDGRNDRFGGGSPSSRRAWIEIHRRRASGRAPPSPSSRRAWIEISGLLVLREYLRRSPSSRRAWIEIFQG